MKHTSRAFQSAIRGSTELAEVNPKSGIRNPMIPLFLGLTALNLLCLGTAAALGYAYGGTPRGGQHILAGAVATLVCCGVHCVGFTYFVATAKWVRHAIDVPGLVPSLAAP